MGCTGSVKSIGGIGMSKERLEEIKNSHLRGIHSLFGTPWVSIPKENFDWLIQRAERVEELVEENKRYREALEEIARGRFSGASYKARKALSEAKKTGARKSCL